MNAVAYESFPLPQSDLFDIDLPQTDDCGATSLW
jgi:hypothetical protein